ncbi:MAG: cryptochrome/photolyase family protein, partial [Saprospiraceae bacterium]|nr:cryptochrome/photolyase family protein [Saprospiraceae bacterium]
MTGKSAFIVFPHQLFEDTEALKMADEVYIIEEYLFFNQLKFHKQKLVFHRASMKYYENYLKENKFNVTYIEATDSKNDITELLAYLNLQNISTIYNYDVCDNWLEKRILNSCKLLNITPVTLDSPLFINTSADLESYFGKKSKYFQTDFYIQQRKKLNLLLDENNKPSGGKWSFDAENRLKYPKDKSAPEIIF